MPDHLRARIIRDERDTMREAIADALLHRYDPRKAGDGGAREYQGMTLLEIARRNLEANGERVAGLSRNELAGLALSRQHTTSDFPAILANVAARTLRAGYEASPQTFKLWMRRATAPDFKQVSRLLLSSAPSFLHVPQGGEFKFGRLEDSKETYGLATYGRLFSISRQALINNDVDAFTRIPQMWGRAAADFESDAAYAPLLGNPIMGDGNALFSAAHGNLAPSGSAVSEVGFSQLEMLLGAQLGLEGRPINAAPKFLIAAARDRAAAIKLRNSAGSQAPGSAPGTVNPYEGAFEVVVDSRLNRVAGPSPWFVAADPNQVDTVEYSYLEGEDGVFLDERAGFEVDGISFKARLDFAVKAIDWRGMAMNPGV